MAKIRQDKGYGVAATILGGLVLGGALGADLWAQGLVAEPILHALPSLSSGAAWFVSTVANVGSVASLAIGGLWAGEAAGNYVASIPNHAERRLSKIMPGWDVSVKPDKVVAQRNLNENESVKLIALPGMPPRESEIVRTYYHIQEVRTTRWVGNNPIPVLEATRIPVGHRVKTYSDLPVDLQETLDVMRALATSRPAGRIQRWIKSRQQTPDTTLKAKLSEPTVSDDSLYKKLGIPDPARRNRNHPYA